MKYTRKQNRFLCVMADINLGIGLDGQLIYEGEITEYSVTPMSATNIHVTKLPSF